MQPESVSSLTTSLTAWLELSMEDIIFFPPIEMVFEEYVLRKHHKNVKSLHVKMPVVMPFKVTAPCKIHTCCSHENLVYLLSLFFHQCAAVLALSFNC